MATRIGVDVGGTFTDVVFYDEKSHEVRAYKGPTDVGAHEDGVVRLLEEELPSEALSSVDYFLHATTIGINALLQRRGAVVGLLTTRGFRDILETRRGDREAMYDLLWVTPDPLVPRRLRVPVTERIRADGEVDTALHEDDIRAAVDVFKQEHVESVAVVFLNAYANSVHELAAERALRTFGFEGGVSLSHLISGEYREYERCSTSVVDAYVRPKVAGYLRSLEGSLETRGFKGQLLITRSGGGAMTAHEAKARPFETIMSGPAAGAVGSAELCRRHGIGTAITADVGGTSFETCLIADGRAEVKYEGVVAGLPVQTPWIDVRSIGAGGGSIAYVDGGLLRVGPLSAGAEPGPVCYGRGGVEPTVTDAATTLGMLGFGELAGGLVLDSGASQRALDKLGGELGIDADAAARGVLKIATASMADAIRSISVERGYDARAATLIAFGGAGPLMAGLLAREVGIRRYAIPNHPGNFSAWGLLGQDITRSATRTAISRLDEEGLAAANRVVAELAARLAASASATERDPARTLFEPALDLRYVGQEYTLTVGLPAAGHSIDSDVDSIASLFSRQYTRTFGHALDEAIEIVSVRATTRRALPRHDVDYSIPNGASSAEPRTIDAYSFLRQTRTTFRVIERSGLAPGSSVEGPTILVEDTATSYLDVGFRADVDSSGLLMVSDDRRD
jgi:N-methylhydantoinase A